jgi:hypothetical protein
MATTDITWTVVKSRTKDLTYLGRRARLTEELATPNKFGLRRVTVEWVDDADPRTGDFTAGDVWTRVVTGDGRTDNFEVLAESVLPR